MKHNGWKSGIGILFFLGVLSGGGFAAPHYGQERIPESKPGPGKVFFYTAKKFGIPMLKASIKIENGSTKKESFSTRFMPPWKRFVSGLSSG